MKNISTYKKWGRELLFILMVVLMPQSVWAEDLTVAAGETVTIPANTYKEYGKLSIAEGGTLINNGTIKIDESENINIINGTLTNNGNFFVDCSEVKIGSTGTLTNSGTIKMEGYLIAIHNYGTLVNQGQINMVGGVSYEGGYRYSAVLSNEGTLYNDFSISTERIINVGALFNSVGALINCIGKVELNFGVLGNHGTIENGSFDKDQNGTAYNTGTIQNSTGVEFSTCTAAHIDGVRCSTCGYYELQIQGKQPDLASDGYYEIGEVLELYWLAVQDNANLKARLTADIDATVLGNSVMIGSKEKPFEGTFEGNGKSITVNIDAQTENYVGLFRAVSGATIQNLTVKGSVKGKMYVGGIAGYSSTPAGKESKFNGCSVEANVSGTERVGGVVGCMTGVLESGISAGGKVTGSVSIDRCLSFGTITASRYAGGIVGYVIEKNTTAEANITISNCCFEGKMVGSAKTIGGLVGYMSCTEMGTGSTQTLANIQSCLSTGICNYVIGNAGYANVEHCYYLEAEGRQLCGTVAATSTIGQKNGSVTATQLANGEAIYLLNNGVTDGSQVWYQNLTNGSFSFTASAETTIYYDYANCSATEKSYHNAPAGYETPGHVWTNTETNVKSEATCTADAVYYKECDRCHAQGTDTWTKTGSAKGHTAVTDAAVAPTCTETGLTEGSHCSVCNEVLEAQEVVAATGNHSFDEAADSYHTLCTVCHHSFLHYTASKSIMVNMEESLVDASGAQLTYTNTFSNGKGVYEFAGTLDCIGWCAFTWKNFTSVIVPISVTSIGASAFNGCSDLTSIIIPGSVTSIGESAFSYCEGLGSLTIPASVTSIGQKAFCNCINLSSVYNYATTPQTYSELFSASTCENVPLYVPSASVQNYRNVDGWKDFATIRCIQHGEAAIDAAVAPTCTVTGKTEGSHCSVCNGVIVAQQEVAALGHDWKETDTYLKSEATCTADAVYYKECERCHAQGTDTWTKTGSAKGHTAATDAAVAPTCTETGLTEGSHCSVCNEVLVAQTVVSAKGHTFDEEADSFHSLCTDCHHSFIYNMSGDGCFTVSYSDSLMDASGKPVYVISNTYDEKNGTYVMEFERPLVTIGSLAFWNQSHLLQIIIPNTVTRIGDAAFCNCSGLNGVFIPNSVTSMGKYVFAGCSFLYQILVDSGNKVYDSRDTCNAIIETASNTLIAGSYNTVIPSSVTSIGEGAFSGLLFDAFSIPNNVISIGEYAFQGCYYLQSVAFQSIPDVGEDAFYSVPNDCEYSLALTDSSYVYTGSNENFPELSSVTYTRTGIKNQWGTIVLPFEVNKETADYALYQCETLLDGRLVLRMPEGKTVAAGTPLFVYKKTTAQSITFSAADNTVSTVLNPTAIGTGITYEGTYSTIQLNNQDHNGCYFIYGDAMWNANKLADGQEVNIRPFHAYLNSVAVADNNSAKLRIEVAGDDATSIDDTLRYDNDTLRYDNCFNLQGQRLAAPQKGLNIINGMKVMVK